jgi:ankyrin repeat protein
MLRNKKIHSSQNLSPNDISIKHLNPLVTELFQAALKEDLMEFSKIALNNSELINEFAEVSFNIGNKTSVKNVQIMHYITRLGALPALEFILNNFKHLIDINQVDSRGCTPLLIATYFANLDMVNLLLQSGANTEYSAESGITGLYLASSKGYEEIASAYLRVGASPSKENKNAMTPLAVASLKGHVDLVKLLLSYTIDALNKPENAGFTPLMLATWKGRTETIKFLIENGANIEQRNNVGATALHIAAQQAQSQAVKLLLKFGASIEATTDKGLTPLYIAATKGHSKVIKILLSAGANTEIVDMDKYTPLMVASETGYDDAVEVLLDAKANLEGSRKCAASPLYLASQNGHSTIVKKLLEAKADFNKVASNKLKPLDIAARLGHKEIVKLLLKEGATSIKSKNNINDITILNMLFAQEYGESLCSSNEASAINFDHNTVDIIAARVEAKFKSYENKPIKKYCSYLIKLFGKTFIKYPLESIENNFKNQENREIKKYIGNVRKLLANNQLNKEDYEYIIKSNQRIIKFSKEEVKIVFLCAIKKDCPLSKLPIEIVNEIAKFTSSTGYSFWKARKSVDESHKIKFATKESTYNNEHELSLKDSELTSLIGEHDINCN